jgi:hypothetical protein
MPVGGIGELDRDLATVDETATEGDDPAVVAEHGDISPVVMGAHDAGM